MDLKTVILSRDEIDCPRDLSNDELEEGFRKWNEYKQRLIKEI